jgi:hypothetical protein
MIMTLYQTIEVDNRDAAQMYGYLEARIETMKRRIAELQRENETLRLTLNSECTDSIELLKSA